MKQKLLIATTNKGKFGEISQFFETLPFIECIGLDDLGVSIEPPEEIYETLEANAELKAKYYADASGYMTIADDGGLYVTALDEWPGIQSARVANTDEKRRQSVLEKLKGVQDRTAQFRDVVTVYNPTTTSYFTVRGVTNGEIAQEVSDIEEGRFGYDPIFFYPPAQKCFGQMTTPEKSDCSPRGKSLQKVKYFLQNTFGSKHIVAPIGILIQDGKVLMCLRNDPHRPEFHEKWEFPGGSVEFGEETEENLTREIKEETGFDIEIVHLLRHIGTAARDTKKYSYQVFLPAYVCRVTGGSLDPRDDEILEAAWFELDDVLNHELLNKNDVIYQHFLPELKKVVAEHNL